MATKRGTEEFGLTEAAQILKYHYLPALEKAFNTETILLSRFQRRQAQVVGDRYIFGVHSAPNWSTAPRPETGVGAFGAGTDTAYLPPPGRQEYDQAYLQRCHYYGGFKLTGPALSAAKGAGAMIDLLGQNMSGLKTNLLKAINRNLLGSENGALTVCGTTGASTTVVVETTNRLQVGMPITIAVASTKALITNGSQEVATIPSDTTFTVGVAVTTDSTHSVYFDGEISTTHAAAAYGMDGTEFIVNSTSGTYADIAQSNDYWAATRIDGEYEFSVDHMFEAVQSMRKKANGKCSLIVTSDKVWRKVANILDPKRQWQGNIKSADLGVGALDFLGIPLTWDPDCHHNLMYFFDERHWAILEEESVNFINKDGAILCRVGGGITGEDAYEARIVWRGNLACYNPAAQAVIYNCF